MEAEATRLPRARLPAVSARTFRRLALLAFAALFLVVVSGATVRLTASGLGCENWPRCGDAFLPEKDFHASVEFGNRVVGLLVGVATLAVAFAAWRARVPRRLFLASLSLPLLVLAQGVLGGITVILELHPLIVMGHFLLALVALAVAVVVVLGAQGLTSTSAAAVPRWLALLALALVPLAAALVVTGAFVTAAGPHSGGVDIRRLGTLEGSLWLHVRSAAVFGVAFLVVAAALLRRRDQVRVESGLASLVLALLVVQMIVGEVQWRSALPWWLVLAHVTLATAIWCGVIGLAALLRPRGSTPSLP